MINVGLGLSVFSSRYSRFDNQGIVWAYIAWPIYTISAFVFPRIACVVNKKMNSKGRCTTQVIQIKAKNEEDEDNDNANSKKRCGWWCWMGFAIFVGYILALVLAISVVVALPRAT